MPTQAPTHRALKRCMHDLLLDEDFERAMAGLKALPPRRAVNPLFATRTSVGVSGRCLRRDRPVILRCSPARP